MRLDETARGMIFALIAVHADNLPGNAAGQVELGNAIWRVLHETRESVAGTPQFATGGLVKPDSALDQEPTP